VTDTLKLPHLALGPSAPACSLHASRKRLVSDIEADLVDVIVL
jgi:hypothetical protein